MNPALSAHNTITHNDSILSRLDHEHATAFEAGCRLAAADVEANGDAMRSDWQPSDYVETAAGNAASKASHAAWLAFESIGNAVACFQAETTEGIMHKARVLRRQAQGLSADEILEGGALKRLAASALKDVLGGADTKPPLTRGL